MRSRRLGVQEVSTNSSNKVRALIDRRCLAPLALNDDVEKPACCAVNQPYHRLPQQLHVNLSVLKLDGSLFDVCVSHNATVAELKWAVEEVFASRQKEISWSHVWGHFCLSYDEQKLITDKACLPKFGIKDGDQLQFIRHMSIQNSPFRERPKNKFACKLLSLSSSKSNAHEEKKETAAGDINIDENQDSSKCNNGYNENEEEDPIPESKFARVFRGWLSTSSLRCIARNGAEGRGRSTSRFAPNCIVGGSGSSTKYIGLKHGRNGRKMG
ncbi:uncharacterized protein LOC122284033 isoform X2 [Carya illinoinensis]|uniref:SNRNP25 ubiquitin-like domain-containing protein n=1 Tax=Carya illinoinensis TaxID=32201 RepID=A0A8T1RSC6_CARIL|nr:uncharacterized protein LOC122284033 isoform X2 [Carya illinoinensis]KAG6669495.1 hypothetical protein CIPAW_01G248700 [Carya illinoinensis]KAG6733973.1 hypothetical protein I3842_01G250100 [Carya illinoinensis]